MTFAAPVRKFLKSDMHVTLLGSLFQSLGVVIKKQLLQECLDLGNWSLSAKLAHVLVDLSEVLIVQKGVNNESLCLETWTKLKNWHTEAYIAIELKSTKQ